MNKSQFPIEAALADATLPIVAVILPDAAATVRKAKAAKPKTPDNPAKAVRSLGRTLPHGRKAGSVPAPPTHFCLLFY